VWGSFIDWMLGEGGVFCFLFFNWWNRLWGISKLDWEWNLGFLLHIFFYLHCTGSFTYFLQITLQSIYTVDSRWRKRKSIKNLIPTITQVQPITLSYFLSKRFLRLYLSYRTILCLSISLRMQRIYEYYAQTLTFLECDKSLRCRAWKWKNKRESTEDRRIYDGRQWTWGRKRSTSQA